MEKITYLDIVKNPKDLYQTGLDFKIKNCVNISNRKASIHCLKSEILQKMSKNLGFYARYHVI